MDEEHRATDHGGHSHGEKSVPGHADHRHQQHHGHRHDHAADHRSAAPARVPEGAIYTCPMHPQIKQPGPGNCPICGMALEPEIAIADEGPSAEYLDMRRRFWIGLALAVPVLIL